MDKVDCAKLAKKTINDFIPRLLKPDARARKGVEWGELIHYAPVHVNKKSSPLPRTSIEIREVLELCPWTAGSS